MAKLTETEIKGLYRSESDANIIRMYVPICFKAHMKLVWFWLHHYNKFVYYIIKPLIVILDGIDLIGGFIMYHVIKKH